MQPFDPTAIFVIFGVVAGIGFVVHLAMAAMVMREARAAGEDPKPWAILAFSRPFVGYAMWRTQSRRMGPPPVIGPGMNQYGPGMPPYGPNNFGGQPWPNNPGSPSPSPTPNFGGGMSAPPDPMPAPPSPGPRSDPGSGFTPGQPF